MRSRRLSRKKIPSKELSSTFWKADRKYRDYLYCDVFHACITSLCKKTYCCAHAGERNYFDDDLKRLVLYILFR